MKGVSHLGFWLLVFACGLFVTPYMFNAKEMRARLVQDVQAIDHAVGPTFGRKVVGAATWLFDSTMGATGADAAITDLVETDANYEQANRYGSTIGVAAAKAADKYADALRTEVYFVMLRSMLVFCWILILLPLAIAVLLDGFMERAKKFETMGFQNPTAFSVGFHLAVLICALPLLYVIAPIPITPLFMPYWALCAALPMSFALTHTQPILTR